MPSDVVDLRDFYRSALGQVARRMIRRAIQRIWPDLHGMRLLGLGYATPFLPALAAGHRAHGGGDAGLARRAALAAGRAQPRRAGRRGRAAVRRLLDRSRAAGPWPRDGRRDPRAAEGGLAGSGRRRPRPDRHAEPARGLGAARLHPVRLRPPLYDVAAVAPVARGAVHAGQARTPLCSCRRSRGA